MELEKGDDLIALPEGRVSVGIDAWLPVRLLSLIGLDNGIIPSPGSSPAPMEAEDTLVLRGPGGIERSVLVTLDATAPVERLDLFISDSLYEEMEVGSEHLVTAPGI